MEIKLIKIHAMENTIKHLHPKTNCIFLPSGSYTEAPTWQKTPT